VRETEEIKYSNYGHYLTIRDRYMGKKPRKYDKSIKLFIDRICSCDRCEAKSSKTAEQHNFPPTEDNKRDMMLPIRSNTKADRR
jgi:hypothetical protein